MKIETDCPWCEIRKSHSSHPYLNQTILPSKVLNRNLFVCVKYIWYVGFWNLFFIWNTYRERRRRNLSEVNDFFFEDDFFWDIYIKISHFIIFVSDGRSICERKSWTISYLSSEKIKVEMVEIEIQIVKREIRMVEIELDMIEKLFLVTVIFFSRFQLNFSFLY